MRGLGQDFLCHQSLNVSCQLLIGQWYSSLPLAVSLLTGLLCVAIDYFVCSQCHNYSNITWTLVATSLLVSSCLKAPFVRIKHPYESTWIRGPELLRMQCHDHCYSLVGGWGGHIYCITSTEITSALVLSVSATETSFSTSQYLYTMLKRLICHLQDYCYVLPLDPEFKGVGDLPALPCEYWTCVIMMQHNIRLNSQSREISVALDWNGM